MNRFMPHGHCFLWQADILSLHVISDAVIALSYFSIPAAIFYFVKKKAVTNRIIPALFISFIMTCGMTHLFTIWNFWNADYWLSGAFKAVCASISFTTAIALWFLLPEAMKVPTTKEFESLTEELKLTNLRLETRVKERTQTLLTINEELESIISVLSHDFKNGINVITGSTELLISTSSIEEREKHFERILKTSERLSEMSKTISHTGSLSTLKMETIDLNKIVNEVLDSFSPQLNPINASWEVDQLPRIHGNESLIHQLFFNLVSNSIKYRSPGKDLHIKIFCEQKNNQNLHLFYQDNGIGIPKDERNLVFEMKARSSSIINNPLIEGSGIGLNFCRRICSAHRATIEIEESKMDGTLFKLSFPI